MDTTKTPPALRLSTLLVLVIFAAAIAFLFSRPSIFTLTGLSTSPAAARHLTLIVGTISWLCGAVVVHRIVGWILWDVLLVRALKVPVPGALRALGGVAVFVVTVICIVGLVFGQSITGFLTALGAGSVALGFALRHLFADIFTGLAVNLDRTLRIGDWIEVTDRSGTTVGQIEEIGWRSTNLRTEDQKTVIIPNSYLGINRITNISRPVPATRFQTSVTLDFSVPVARAKRILLASLHATQDSPGFLREREPEVLASQSTDRGLEYQLRYWIEPWTGISPNRARDLVTASAIEHLRTAGIAPAYEKTDIYHRDMPTRNWEAHTREDQLRLLARLDIFSMLERAELEAISDACARRIYPAGMELFRQGAEGDSLFILTEGLLEVTITNESGGEQRVGRVLAGEFVGEMSLLTGEPRSATVRAVTSCVVYEISGAALHPLVAARPEIAEMLCQVIAERRLRNADAARQRDTGGDEEVAGFARQMLTRMLSFLAPR